MTLYVMIAVALAVGIFLPLRWHLWGFLAASAALFIAQAGVSTAGGYEGLPFAETLVFFNESWASYVGYNLQLTYRAFALPLFALAVPFVFRLGRS
ncbi:hypothetical protein [Sulfitobacter donghicola]|uniref:Uncharacterized protein n=1 Tax=Sulfitobacter donghicola DSW-25 = KCTC 12864 = JCM 14565 TaxID=1300350 RepID=A0A073ILA2_9RHOB|nr:hypothetical protein [Sulfitobacter donghicola]KEJ91083.1 hypothetical protein DSW25_02650 [Sulfitobacter donghicola DSW-25 = KCTC 12864 = JCM 14565]KIN68092.1 hypothetical protein Z948_1819 [Sulfitobacter donghicola DSW-25 = KCTC 12864 = JCM 14565]